MNKIRVIDLLNKIANGEEVPKKVKYLNQVFELTNNKVDWHCYDYNINLLGNEIGLQQLNDTIEILEEEKKIPEKLPLSSYHNSTDDIKEKVLINKINEIIDCLDYLKSKGDE